jgi:hypothetical protein
MFTNQVGALEAIYVNSQSRRMPQCKFGKRNQGCRAIKGLSPLGEHKQFCDRKMQCSTGHAYTKLWRDRGIDASSAGDLRRFKPFQMVNRFVLVCQGVNFFFVCRVCFASLAIKSHQTCLCCTISDRQRGLDCAESWMRTEGIRSCQCYLLMSRKSK